MLLRCPPPDAPGSFLCSDPLPHAFPHRPNRLSPFLPFFLPTDFFLEDAIEATGFAIGRSSKWAKKGGSGGKKDEAGEGGGGGGGGATAAADGYSEQTRIALSNVDESLINTELIEALVAHLVASRGRQQGGGAGKGDDANAILIFAPGELFRVCTGVLSSGRPWCSEGRGMCWQQRRVFCMALGYVCQNKLFSTCNCTALALTCSLVSAAATAGADEISRICRTLSSSGRVAAAAGGGVQVRA